MDSAFFALLGYLVGSLCSLITYYFLFWRSKK